MAKIAKIVCKILGVLYTLAGLGGLVFGDAPDRYHNVLHLLTGLIALYFGFFGSLSGAKVFCLMFGIGYLAFGIFGFIMGNPATDYLWDINLIGLSKGDHIHHIVLGTIILASGIFTKGGGSQLSTGFER